MKIDKRFVRKVWDYQPYLLPTPRLKTDSIENNRAETLEELGIITVETEIWSSSI